MDLKDYDLNPLQLETVQVGFGLYYHPTTALAEGGCCFLGTEDEVSLFHFDSLHSEEIREQRTENSRVVETWEFTFTNGQALRLQIFGYETDHINSSFITRTKGGLLPGWVCVADIGKAGGQRRLTGIAPRYAEFVLDMWMNEHIIVRPVDCKGIFRNR